MTPTVLITDHPFHNLKAEEAVLGELGAQLVVAGSTDEEQLVELAGSAEAILACYGQVTARVIDAAAAAGCRIVSRYGIGYDNVDIEAATARGIVVTTVPDYCLGEVADHTMALLLAHARSVVASAEDVRAGRWALPTRPCHRLAGQVLALIGFGAIGRRVAARARSFELDVVVYDPYAEEDALAGLRRAASVAEAVAEADFVSLHAPLTAETERIIDRDALAAATRRPLIVNTARGGLVDLDAVAWALAEDRIGGAALDVAVPEPLPAEHPLLGDPRVIVTPHIAFYSEESQVELQARAAAEVARVLRGERPENPRNPEVLQADTEAE